MYDLVKGDEYFKHGNATGVFSMSLNVMNLFQHFEQLNNFGVLLYFLLSY